MSWQLWVLNVLLRRVVKPQVRRTTDPDVATRRFEVMARLFFRGPPDLTLRRDAGVRPALSWITAGSASDDKVILFLHGGAYFVGSARAYSRPLGWLARYSGVPVCAPDYRLLQTAPFPAAFEDAIAAWDALIAAGYAPGRIVLGGDSAGGGLMFALLSYLLSRGQRPAGVFAMSPWTDLTLTGQSIATHGPRDPIIPVDKMGEAVDRYLDGADAADPRASPLFAEFSEPPPVLLHVGSKEALLDDTQRIASRLRAAGGVVTVHIWDNAPHVFQLGVGWIPESRAAWKEIAGFVQTSFESANR